MIPRPSRLIILQTFLGCRFTKHLPTVVVMVVLATTFVVPVEVTAITLAGAISALVKVVLVAVVVEVSVGVVEVVVGEEIIIVAIAVVVVVAVAVVVYREAHPVVRAV